MKDGQIRTKWITRAQSRLVLAGSGLFTVCVFALVATASATQDFAPKAELPAGADANSMVVVMLSGSEVPSSNAVGVPAYPGALVVQVIEMPNLVTEEPTGNVRLISSDPPETVDAWYTENLQGWSRSEGYGTITFGEGGREFNPMKPDTWGVLPSVKVEGTDMYDYTDFWPDVQTVIDISYALN